MGAWDLRKGHSFIVRVGVGAALLLGGLVAIAGPAAAAASINAPSSGQAGKNILISGSGWTGLESVSAYLVQGSSKAYFCGLSTDGGGNLGPQACTLPTSLAQGVYTLSVTDTTVTVNTPFTLNPAAHVSATSGGAAIGSVAAGQTVYLSGSGFSAGSTISTVKVGATAVTTNPAAPAISVQGNFSGATFMVPASLGAGVVTVTATDSASHTATFNLRAYAATDTSPASGISGRNLAVSGTAWPINDTVYAYLNQGATQNYFCSIATDAVGGLGPQACLLPTSLPQGSYVLSLTDQKVTVNAPFTLNPGAHVTATSSGGAIGSAGRGQTVYLSGSGFSASTTVTSVQIGTTAAVTTPATPAVSAQGAFGGATFVVPTTVSAGNQTVTVTDSAGKSATFKLDVFAATDAAATTGISGRNLKISGAGWPNNDTAYAYLVQGATQTYFCTIATDASGNLGPQSCGLPTSLPRGSYTLSVTDQSVTVNKNFTLNPGAHVSPTSNGAALGSVAAGQTVYLSGTGFSASSTITSLKVGTTVLALSPAAPAVSAQGSFSGETFTVPSTLGAGTSNFTVTDSSSKTAAFSLTVYDATVIASAAGAAGHNLAISGAGWPINDTVYAYLDQGATQAYFCTLTTDDSGALGPLACPLPGSLPQGSYTLSLTDQSVTVNTAFTLNPETNLFNPSSQQINSAAPGATINVTGNGFTASSTITSVKVGSTTVTTSPSPPLVTAAGSFSGTSFVVPSLAAGAYTVKVTDSSGKAATATLTIT